MRKVLLRSVASELNDSTYDEKTIKKILYGLESLYINLSKLLFVLLIAILMNNLLETISLLFFSKQIRKHAYGLHLSNNYSCLFFSIILINLLPFFTKDLDIISNLIILFFSLLSIVFYSPATTRKGRQLTSYEQKRCKTISSIIASIYCLVWSFNIPILSFSALNALLIQSIIVNPVLFNIVYERRKNEKVSK